MQPITTWLVIGVALAAANLPFLSNRLFGIFAFKTAQPKSVGVRLIEWFIFYFLVGSMAYLLEQSSGQAHNQAWAFYAITVCLFAVFAYPGIVYRFLYKARSA